MRRVVILVLLCLLAIPAVAAAPPAPKEFIQDPGKVLTIEKRDGSRFERTAVRGTGDDANKVATFEPDRVTAYMVETDGSIWAMTDRLGLASELIPADYAKDEKFQLKTIELPRRKRMEVLEKTHGELSEPLARTYFAVGLGMVGEWSAQFGWTEYLVEVRDATPEGERG